MKERERERDLFCLGGDDDEDIRLCLCINIYSIYRKGKQMGNTGMAS